MILGHKITVATPVLNEDFFLPVWLACVQMFADEIVVTDGGSTDASVKILLDFSQENPEIDVDLKYEPQKGKPYSDDWNEGMVRNDLLARATGDFIVFLDADELMRYVDVLSVIGTMQREEANRAMFIHIPFWGDFQTVRVNTKEDQHWFGVNVARIVRKGTCHFSDAKHHCILHGEPVLDSPGLLFHMHYAFGPSRLKEGDCRLYDFGNTPIMKVKTEPYPGPLPFNFLSSMYPKSK